MKVRLGLVVLLVSLAGCANFPGLAPGQQREEAPRRYGSNDILREADHLASRVKNGEITRVEAADQLNRFRLAHIGRNVVDDNTFALYRSLTVARERNQITQDASMSRMHARLIEWESRWPTMNHRPANPAFTNFLMTVYDLPPLTQ